MRTNIVLLLIAQLTMSAQQEAPPLPQTAARFVVTTQLVVVNVSARDKNGNALEDLKASDFIVTEDGKPQQIRVFEYQRLEDQILP